MEYEVRLPEDKISLKVTQRKKKTSKIIGRLLSKDRVIVTAISGGRANIKSPIHGWCSLKSSKSPFNTYLYKCKLDELTQLNGKPNPHKKPPPPSVDNLDGELQQAIQRSRETFLRDELEITVQRLRIVGNHRELNDHYHNRRDSDPSFKSMLKELRQKKARLEELLNPTLPWACLQCTYENPPVRSVCAMCLSPRSTDVNDISSGSLKLLKRLEEPGAEEQELIHPMPSPPPEDPITGLKSQLDLMASKMMETSAQVEQLEESNWNMQDEVETLKSKISKVSSLVDLEKTDPLTWDTTCVSLWLTKLKMEDYSDDFEATAVDGAALFELDEEKLRDLEVGRKHRQVILDAVAELKKKHLPHEPPSPHDKPLDKTGVICYLGTNQNTTSFQNPATMGKVRLSSSPLAEESAPLDALVGLSAKPCITKSTHNAWMCLEFPGFAVKPTHYTLNIATRALELPAPRSWRLEGSQDGMSWHCIREHKNDTKLGQVQSHTWECYSRGFTYSNFRIILTGPNSKGTHQLALSGIDLYGDAVKRYNVEEDHRQQQQTQVPRRKSLPKKAKKVSKKEESPSPNFAPLTAPINPEFSYIKTGPEFSYIKPVVKIEEETENAKKATQPAKEAPSSKADEESSSDADSCEEQWEVVAN